MKKLILFIFISHILSCSSSQLNDGEEFSENVTVSEIRKAYSIIPNCYEMDRALIFYPGGLVEPEAYIPLAVLLADQLNIAVFIQKMPFNLAIFGSHRADIILAEYDYIDTWYLAGHSLGGVMAASYIYENPKTFDALFLLASYPVEKKSLKDHSISVLSIRGSEDGLVERDQIRESLNNLPDKTVFKEIPGANHSQFGSYGRQKGDNVSTISEKEQQNKTVKMMGEFLESISSRRAD
ncbi:MAG: hypothetical protein JEY91_07580 [Spirochaetaceae bacterium]|nr:hypothetical protein [Spirochaetaceae bacterium]